MANPDQDQFTEAWQAIWFSNLKFSAWKGELARLIQDSPYIKKAARIACACEELGRDYVDDLILLTTEKLITGPLNIEPTKIADFLFVSLRKNSLTMRGKVRRQRKLQKSIDPEFLNNIPAPDKKGVLIEFDDGTAGYFTARDFWKAINRLGKIDSVAASVYKLRVSGNSIRAAAKLMGITYKKAAASSERGRSKLYRILRSML